MKTMKSILRFSLILYLCLLLTGASYILTASAKITPNPDMEGTALITIVKGDTCGVSLQNISKIRRNGPSSSSTTPFPTLTESTPTR